MKLMDNECAKIIIFKVSRVSLNSCVTLYSPVSGPTVSRETSQSVTLTLSHHPFPLESLRS